MNFLSSFGESLSELMLEEDLSCRALSKAAKIPSSAISMYKRGITSPTIKNLIKLAKYFNCSIDYLIGRTNIKMPFSEENNAHFLDRVKLLLDEHHIKFYRIALECGFSDSLMPGWKKGSTPLIETVISIADYFCVSTDYLLGLTDKK